VVFLWEDRGLLAKLLSGKKVVYLGALSYSIYLLHIPIRNSMHYVFPKLNLSVSETLESQLFVFTSLALTIVLSSFTYHCFEKPCRDKLKTALNNVVFREN
jgi:peptidoglycan/LPS O-acetylase OafA/YrhL